MSDPNIQPQADAVVADTGSVKASIEQQLVQALADRPGRNRVARTAITIPAGESSAEPVQDSPVAPEVPETVAAATDPEMTQETQVPESVNQETQDVINFLDFAKTNPQAKIRIPNKNAELGFVELSAEKAASILGQGSAIHEEQRQFKVRESEFREYEQQRRAELDNLHVALEYTVEPRISKAYQGIRQAQDYNEIFKQQLTATNDPAQQAEIQANIEKNLEYIQQQSQYIQQTRPVLDQYREFRSKQVKETLDNTRKNFQDRELRNEYLFNEIKTKISTGWNQAEQEFIPGIRNIDLVSSDEHILSLIRDGLKFREGVKSDKNAGNSVAAVTASMKRGVARGNERTQTLQQQASKGDKTAQRDLLSAYLLQQKAVRKA